MGLGQGPGRDHLKNRMDAATALAGYEAARHRLPRARTGGAGREVADLSAIADDFDTFLLDAFGVLNIGEDAIPGVPERIAELQSAGKRVLVLTNAASVPNDTLTVKYAHLGYRFAPEDVISSRSVLLSALRATAARHWGIMAPEELQEGDLADLNLTYLREDPAAYAGADAILLLGSAGWTDARQELLERALLDNPRPVWVGNPDIVAPRQYGFSVEPGFYAHQLADRTGIEPRFFGKPFRNIFDAAAERLGGFDPGRTVMVGDSLHTDVLGAHSAGIASALVAGYGFLAGQPARQIIAQTRIEPDFILDRP